MARTPPSSHDTRGTRRLLLVSVVFGLVLLCEIGLFGWLMFRTMSQREIERVLLDTRREAESLAQRIAEGAEGKSDLYTAIAVEQETQTYIDSIPRQRDIVRSVEIRDQEGRLVFESRNRATIPESPEDGQPILENPELALGEEQRQVEYREETFDVPDIEVAIGDLGTLRIGISPQRLRQRIEALRSDLISQTSVLAILTLGLLLAAYLIIWWSWHRARRLEEAAAEAERMAYIGTLASGLAHEIRNPLNSLNLNVQMIQEEIDGGQTSGTVARLMSITRSEISRLERLANDFLSYARPREPEREEVRPAELFDRVRELLAGELERRRARLEVADDSDSVLSVDVAQLTQLLLNLVGNALSAAEEADLRPQVRLSAERRGDEVVLAVADRGPGIPADEQERIFDVFYSGRKGGTGLGLAIVDRIAKNHDGRVELDSVPGEGATFRVILPAADG